MLRLEKMDPPKKKDHHSVLHQESEETTEAFASLISAMGPAENKPAVSKFVKRMEEIP